MTSHTISWTIVKNTHAAQIPVIMAAVAVVAVETTMGIMMDAPTIVSEQNADIL